MLNLITYLDFMQALNLLVGFKFCLTLALVKQYPRVRILKRN